ncbi:hypothetical protein [Streptomyces jeddahensis]|uniref:Uncharacterized protein n=1 Tax=Streptomyces jeddahensis TaxID=1716141 RepID=A0A177HQF4_9ACTN|nr:hypothetical protein [Streptomyces jeddahensis]OAH12966.1 hypothetical protein STSP_36120 [Streptomyces jeddahensis]
MDLESIEAELYGLAPEDFIAARDQYAAAARKENDRPLAAKISALRRPTLAAWASNLLARAEPEQVAGLLRLGEGLRQAHEQLDGPQLRELNRQQHGVVAALARQARLLAAEAGHPVGEDVQRELEETLHAALADPEAARHWASGRLTKALRPPVGTQFFAGTETDAAATAGTRRKPTAAEPAPTVRRAPARDSQVPTAQEAKERRRQEDRRQKLVHARQEAEGAEQRARLRQDELRQAEARREQAERLQRELDERVAELAEELKAAQERQRTARSDLDAARQEAAEAGRIAQKARRDAQTARARAERLEGS